QQMLNAVQPGALLVDGLHNPPWSLRNARAFEHYLLCLGIGLPTPPRLNVHRTELPLLERIMDAHQETELLLLVGDREPIFDEDDAGTDQHALELRHGAEELLDLLLRAEAHHALDTGPVVPAAIEQHDLAAGRQMWHIPLEVPLHLFALARRRQR